VGDFQWDCKPAFPFTRQRFVAEERLNGFRAQADFDAEMPAALS